MSEHMMACPGLLNSRANEVKTALRDTAAAAAGAAAGEAATGAAAGAATGAASGVATGGSSRGSCCGSIAPEAELHAPSEKDWCPRISRVAIISGIFTNRHFVTHLERPFEIWTTGRKGERNLALFIVCRS